MRIYLRLMIAVFISGFCLSANGQEYPADGFVDKVKLAVRRGVAVQFGAGFSSEARTHIQGVAILKNGNLVLTHTVGRLSDSTEYELHLLDRSAKKHIKGYSFNMPGEGWPSGAQACKDIVAVAAGGQIQFVDFNKSPPVRLDHLTIPVGTENVGFAFHPEHQCYYVAIPGVGLWNCESEPANSNSKFTKVDGFTGADQMKFGEAGMNLVYDEPSKSMFTISFGSDRDGNRDSPTKFSIAKISGTKGQLRAQLEKYGSLKMKTEITTLGPSFRWGAGLRTTSTGDVDLVVAPRDLPLIPAGFPFAVFNSGMKNYRVEVQTTNRSGAGTDANIQLRIHGTRKGKNVSSEWETLNPYISGNAFEQGDHDVIEAFRTADVGKIISISVKTDNAYAGAAWNVDWLKVDGVHFNASGQEMNGSNKEIWLKSGPPPRNYALEIHTGTKSGAGTDSNITVTIHGTKGQTAGVVVNPLMSGNVFENGAMEKVTLTGQKDVGTVNAITITSDDKYAGSGWYLEWVRVDGKMFRCDDWIESGKLTKTLR